jgi:cation transport regulator ChaB
MRYQTIEDLPFHCQLNLPEAAQHVYKDAFNRLWAETADERAARSGAFAAVHERFEKDRTTGRWVPKSPRSLAPRERGEGGAKRRVRGDR